MANDVSAPMPQVDLLPYSIVTVTVDQAGAKVTGLNVHGWQEQTAPVKPPDPVRGAYLPGTEV